MRLNNYSIYLWTDEPRDNLDNYKTHCVDLQADCVPAAVREAIVTAEHRGAHITGLKTVCVQHDGSGHNIRLDHLNMGAIYTNARKLLAETV